MDLEQPAALAQVPSQVATTLQPSEAQFRAIIEHGVEGIVLLGTDLQTRYVGPTITTLLGYAVETFATLRAHGLCHPDDMPQLEAFIATLTAHAGATGQVTTRLQHQNGTWRWMEQRGSNQTHHPDIAAIIVSMHDVTEQIRAEQALQANQQQLGLALEVAQLTAWDWEVATGTIIYTTHASSYFHLPPGQLTRTVAAFNATVYPPDYPAYTHIVTEALKTGSPYQLRVRVFAPDNQVHWLEVRGLVQHNTIGQPVRVIGVTRDISGEQQLAATAQAAQQAAAEAHAQLDAIITNAPNGIGYLDQDLRYVLVNPALADLNGRAASEYLGRSLTEMLPGIGPRLEPHMRQVLATGDPVRDLELHGRPSPRDGASNDWLISLFPVPGMTGEVAGVGVTVVNISQHKRTATALRASEERFRLLAEHAHDVIFRYKLVPTPLLEYLSPAVERLTGYPRAVFYRDPKLIERVVAAADLPSFRQLCTDFSAHPQPLLLRGQHQDGTLLWVEFHSWLITDEAGQPQAIEGIVRDITARKQAETALQAHSEALSLANAELAQALQLKGEFLAMMSHELRTPLNVVLGFTEAMEAELYGPLSAAQRRVLGLVRQSGRHLLQILADILDLAYIEAGRAVLNAQPVALAPLCYTVLQAVQTAAEQKDLRLVCRVVPGATGLHADERRLTQMLLKLLDNAVKFTPTGGMVGLEVQAHPEQACFTFAVWDTGIGIAAADYARLFQPFTQVDGRLARQYDGVGLGLTLVRRLVELHGGSISLESTPGQGSRFTVSLPWAATALVEAVPQGWVAPRRVVLADHHEPTLQAYAEELRHQGCQVGTARTGTEAVAQVRALHPEVVVLALQLPELDGLTVTRHLRTDPSLAAVRIIVLNAVVLPGDDERCLAAGATLHCTKPVSIHALLTLIAAVLEQEAKPATYT